MTQVDDLSRSLIAFEQNSTMVVVLEMSQSSWLAAGVVPGIERRPLKKLDPDPTTLLRLVEGWRDHAMKAGRMITRIVLAFEAGRDGFWLARWLRARSIEPFVIHSTSVAVSREHRRAKTDRLDTEMLIRVFLGWLRGEPRHCKMVAIPTLEEEDARRPSRERESLISERTRIINRMKAALIRLGIRGFKPELLKAPQRLEAQYTAEGVPIPPNMLDELRRDMARLAWVRQQINAIEQARLERLEQAPSTGPHAMVRMLASIIGVGVETSDIAGAGDPVAKPSRSTGRSSLRRPHRVARRERGQTTREGLGKGGQCTRAARPHSAGVALPALPEGKRTGAMVSSQDRRCGGKA
jgi:transposase